MQSNIGENARSPALTKTIKRYAIQDREKRVKAASGKERKMEEKQKTIYDLLDEVAETMCDKYCNMGCTAQRYIRKMANTWSASGMATVASEGVNL